MWEQQSKPSDLGWTGLHPDLGAARLGLDLPGPARILVLDCLFLDYAYEDACGKLQNVKSGKKFLPGQRPQVSKRRLCMSQYCASGEGRL